MTHIVNMGDPYEDHHRTAGRPSRALEGRGPAALYWRAFLIVGVLGALTTYSALMLECLLYAKSQRSGLMFGYLAITLVSGLALADPQRAAGPDPVPGYGFSINGAPCSPLCCGE